MLNGTGLTLLVLSKDRNDLVDELDAGSSLLLRLSDHIRVTPFVRLH